MIYFPGNLLTIQNEPKLVEENQEIKMLIETFDQPSSGLQFACNLSCELTIDSDHYYGVLFLEIIIIFYFYSYSYYYYLFGKTYKK